MKITKGCKRNTQVFPGVGGKQKIVQSYLAPGIALDLLELPKGSWRTAVPAK